MTSVRSRALPLPSERPISKSSTRIGRASPSVKLNTPRAYSPSSRRRKRMSFALCVPSGFLPLIIMGGRHSASWSMRMSSLFFRSSIIWGVVFLISHPIIRGTPSMHQSAKCIVYSSSVQPPNATFPLLYIPTTSISMSL